MHPHDGTRDAPTEPRTVRLIEVADLDGVGLGGAALRGDVGNLGDPQVSSALRDALFGGTPFGPGARRRGSGPDSVAMPAAPALLYDRSDRIVRVNAALLRLAGRRDEAGVGGMRLPQLFVGPDTDARLMRSDGRLVRVRVVRWDLPEQALAAVVLVEQVEASPAQPGRAADRRWTTELERLARIGTWRYELATATLHRSETLQELYRSVGLDPQGEAGSGPVEGDQVALLCQALGSGQATRDDHVELRLPGGHLLDCRAEVQHDHDGTPARLVGVVRDVTEQRAAEGRGRYSGQRFADLMALVPGGVALIDSSGRVVDANAGMCALLGAPLEQLRGRPARSLSADRVPDADVSVGTSTGGAPTGSAARGRASSGGAPTGGALPSWLCRVPPGAEHSYRIGAVALRRADGTTVWCELAGSVTSSDDGGWFWLIVCTDVSDRRRAAELLRSAATIDELTRLPNRAAGLALVDRLLAGPGRERVAVVCGDLDDFARVNSSLGYATGDDLLVKLACRLQRELPQGCTAARLSGDEFVVICADHADVGGPDLLARRVADLLRATITVHGRPVQMTASVGLATPVPCGEVRAADLLRFAEAAMHDAKRRQGRGAIGVATDGVVSSATQALELEAELRATIAAGGLVLEYQPVVGPDGTMLSAEALVRWPHPERGLIAPGEFLPVAQRSGLLRELDLWVLRTATREAASWPQRRGRRAAIAVNLAGLLPGDAGFVAAVTEIVTDAGLPWDQLVLELVETSLVALPAHALAAMAELVASGVRFAVDDFGTGYSSLARLKELPAQIVKVDRAFVTGVGSDPADFAVARAVVDMARAMGRTTVAEGVETAEQFHVLRGIGVDAYQGWLFARALAPAALRELLVGGRLATPAASVLR